MRIGIRLVFRGKALVMKKTFACFTTLGLAFACALALPSAGVKADDQDGFKPLFNGKDLTGWKTFHGTSDVKPEEIWVVKDGVIHCTGKVNGYLITEKDYADYVLKMQWRWPAKPGNSGVFVHVKGEDKIWPKGLEAQLMDKIAGDIFLVGGFTMDIDSAKQTRKSNRILRLVDNVEKPAGEWNEYVITCKGDAVNIVINGKEVNYGTKTEFRDGKILLQSEGAPIEFRDISIKSLK